MRTWTTTDPHQTHALGRSLGAHAFAGTVVALNGDLGAGKTAFAQGVGAGLGVSGVVSPTFIVVSTHEEGTLPLFHADVYRVDSAAELEQTGLEELLGADGVCLVEWADKHAEVLPEDHLEVRIHHLEQGRRITMEAHGPRHAALLERIDG